MVQESAEDVRLLNTRYEGNSTGDELLVNYASLAEAEFTLGAYADWGLSTTGEMHTQRTEKLLKSVENKFRDSHAVGYFVVSEKRDDLSVRQKDWFDNAMPAGNSMLLQAYAQLEAVTQNFSSSSCFHDLSQAYGGMVKNVPHGIAHALDAMTREATGWVVVKYSSKSDLDSLRNLLLGFQTPRGYRPLFLHYNKNVRGFQVCVGKTCHTPTESPEKAVEII
jgi:uncharacterized protein YyaL (SSP411 family)